MKQGRWADRLEIIRQRSRNRVIRVATLEAEGMDSSTVYRRCLPGGPWRKLLPGVVMLQNSAPTREQMVIAALLYAGPRALVTGVEACRRQNLRTGPGGEHDPIHVLTPHDEKVVSSGFVVVERTHRLPATVFSGQVPLAPVGRAALDAARRLRSSDEIAKLLIEAVQRGGCTVRGLRWELEHGSQRGTAIPRRILGDIAGLRSVAELHGRRLTNHLSVPPTHWNPALYTPDGTYIGRPDAWWDDVGLAWEIDSVEFHYSSGDYAQTLTRNGRYAQTGILVLQTLPSRLRSATAAVVGELDAAYRAAAASPRPDVHLEPAV